MNDRVEVIESSGISAPEVIMNETLDKCSNNDLSVKVEEKCRSEKAALWCKEGGSNDAIAAVEGMSA